MQAELLMDSRPRADAGILQCKPMPRTGNALINQLVLRKQRAKFGAISGIADSGLPRKDEKNDEFATMSAASWLLILEVHNLAVTGTNGSGNT